jgi:hypothetical protein
MGLSFIACLLDLEKSYNVISTESGPAENWLNSVFLINKYCILQVPCSRLDHAPVVIDFTASSISFRMAGSSIVEGME